MAPKVAQFLALQPLSRSVPGSNPAAALFCVELACSLSTGHTPSEYERTENLTWASIWG
ncbi:hypothetical protein NQZ68_021774, partial [Dissostichus eleginoides]